MNHVLLTALLFFKIGALSFGDGLAMTPAIYQNLSQFRLITSEGFTNMLAVSQITPGPIAINLATYIGMEKGGILSALLVTLAVATPSMILAIALLKMWDKLKDNRKVEFFLEGIKASALGLVASTIILMTQEITLSYFGIFLILATFLSLVIFKINPTVLLIISGVIGSIFLV